MATTGIEVGDSKLLAIDGATPNVGKRSTHRIFDALLLVG